MAKTIPPPAADFRPNRPPSRRRTIGLEGGVDGAIDPSVRTVTVPHPGPSRTRGFLFADLRGYTDFVETRGDHAAAELLSAYRTLVREAVARFEGAEIKTEGDSFYVVFDSASAAVECGRAIVEAAREASQKDPSRPMHVGVGIHAGETVETSEGLVGSAINIAARVCSVAGPGEVLVTDTVRSLTRTFLEVGFVPLGPRPLKGVAEPIPLFRVDLGGEQTRGMPWAARQARRSLVRPAAAITAVTIVAVAVGAFLLPRDAGPVPPSGSSAAVSPPPSTSAPAASATLSPAEASLLARTPSRVRTNGATCGSSPTDEGAFGAVAGIRCDLPLGEGAATVWYDQLDSSALVQEGWSSPVRIHALPEGDCSEQPRAFGEWSLEGSFSGHLVCYGDDGGSWVVWTYEGFGIVARANRPDANWKALYAWWQLVGPFLLG